MLLGLDPSKRRKVAQQHESLDSVPSPFGLDEKDLRSGRCTWFQYVAKPFLCGVTKPSTGLLKDVNFVLLLLSIESRLFFLGIRVYGNGE